MNPVWIRQIQGIARLEVRKILFSLRNFPVYILAALPVAAAGLVFLTSFFIKAEDQEWQSVGEMTQIYSYAFQLQLLVAFIGCALIFMNLIRGEVLDRSLHYYFLSPLRREILLIGKFIAGWIASALIFCTSALLSMFLFYGVLGVGQSMGFLLGAGFSQMIAYLAMIALACLGYGAVFLATGLFLKNPIIPALFLLTWEYFLSMLPPLLQKISVNYYLSTIRPVPIEQSWLAIVSEPISPWFGIPGLIVFSFLVVTLASLKIRSMEVSYGDD